jgi:hypothetical protein
MKYEEAQQTGSERSNRPKCTGKRATNSNAQLYELGQWIVLHRLPNGFHSGSAEFRGQIKTMGWLGLEPRTNALKGRCSTIELPTRQETSSENITKSLRCN